MQKGTRWFRAFVTLLAGVCLLTSTLMGAETRKVKKLVPLTYPPLALKMRVEGTVTLEATVDADGTVRDVKAISGHALLKTAAAQTVKQWQYDPADRTDVITFDVNYRLPQ